MPPETPYERVVRFLREQPASATVPYRDDKVPLECPIAFEWTDACPGDATELPSIRVRPDGGRGSAVEVPAYAASIRELWTSWWLERLEPARDGVRRRRVWTLDAIEAALADWSARHAGRSDLRFAFDPSPSFMADA